jgi:hypothetical protein
LGETKCNPTYDFKQNKSINSLINSIIYQDVGLRNACPNLRLLILFSKILRTSSKIGLIIPCERAFSVPVAVAQGKERQSRLFEQATWRIKFHLWEEAHSFDCR